MKYVLYMQSKHVIALKCRETQGPTSGQWITELASNLALEKVTYMRKGKGKDFMNNLYVQTL